jgi:hypothetical protein
MERLRHTMAYDSVPLILRRRKNLNLQNKKTKKSNNQYLLEEIVVDEKK